MDELQFQRLDPVKIPLIKRFYKQHYPSGKARKDDEIYTASLRGNLCAVVRFRSVDRYRLLTGMAVDSSLRHQGIGSQLLIYCQQNTLSQGDYCFAFEHLASFYRQHGFQVVTQELLPNTLKNLLLRYLSGGKSLIPMQYSAQDSLE